jgi:hypothetical protein
MPKKKKEFLEEQVIESVDELSEIQDIVEIKQEPIFEVITEPKKQKTKIDFSQWSYKDLLSYCEKNKIETMWKNPQQIRAMLQERGE